MWKIWLLICVCTISGCVLNVRLIPTEDTKIEEEKILQSFGDSGIILKAFKEIGASVVDVAGFLHEYGKTDMEGFCEYLRKQYPLNTQTEWWLDENIFDPALRNYKLFRR